MSTKRKKKKNKVVLFAVEILVLVALLVGLFVYSKLGEVDNTGDLAATEVDIELDSQAAELVEGYTNIALFGLDNRKTGNYSGGNSDSIMLVNINNETKEVKLISIYRDTFLNVKEDTYDKINSAYAYGGAKGAVAALNRNLNLNIVDYVAVDFRAVVDAVDLMDGIELTLTDDEVRYMNELYMDEITDVTGKSSSKLSGGGTYQVDGVQALAYCRLRATAGDDFKRTERQRTVLLKLIEKAKGSSFSTVTKVINSLFDEISTSFTSKEMLSLASGLMDYEVADSHGWPFELCTGTFGSKSLVVATDLETNVEQLHEYLYGETAELSDTVIGISDYIRNYTGCTVDDASRIDNPLTGNDNTSTTDTGLMIEEAAEEDDE